MSRDRKVYNTPGRECQHADSGCCPRCMDPCAGPPSCLKPDVPAAKKTAKRRRNRKPRSAHRS